MANSLTSLAADIYKAADIVGREAVGFIPSVLMNSDAIMKVALNDTVRSAFTRTSTLNTSYTPAMTIPEGDDQTIDNKTMTIAQVANVKIPWTGEDIKHVNNGSGFATIYGDQITQAMRKITNAIEIYLAGVVYKGASRAYGTAGTTPFSSNFNDLAQLRKILVDNGCPMDGEVVGVYNTTAGANLRSLTQLQKANESADTSLLRQGMLSDLLGIKLKESAGVALTVAGTGASYQVNNVGPYALNTTAIIIGTGSGTLLAGDIVTFAGDTNKYVVNIVGTTTLVTLATPGLQKILANSVAMTVGGAYTANVVFHRKAVELVVRAPAMPPGGDAAVDRMTVADPWSGLIYELALYKGYGKQMLDITTFYDAKAWKPDFIATHLG